MSAVNTFAWALVLSAALLLSAAAHAGADDQPTVIPFTVFKSNIVVEVTIPPGKTLPFAFDSGLSEGNILTVATARALGLELQGRARFTDSSGSRGVAAVAVMDWIEISGAVLRNQKFAIIPVSPTLIKRPDKPPIAGYIGAPLLKNAVVCVDYADRELRRWSSGGFDASGMASIPLQVNHGLVTITVHVDGVPATLAVDTGSDGGVQFFPEFVDKHDLHKRYTGMIPYTAMSGAGQTFRILRGTADTVRIGDTTLNDVPMAFISQVFNPHWGIDGLLGYRVLSRLNPCIDRPSGRFVWAADE